MKNKFFTREFVPAAQSSQVMERGMVINIEVEMSVFRFSKKCSYFLLLKHIMIRIKGVMPGKEKSRNELFAD